MTLLVVTFVVAFAVASIIVLIFSRPIDGILHRVISDEISQAWAKYLKYAIYVVGIGGGVRVWAFEKYLTPEPSRQQVVELTRDRWVLEVYETVMGTL